MDEDEVEARARGMAQRAGHGVWDPLNVANVSIVVGSDGGLPEFVGTILTPDGERIIGTLPDTPADELGIEEISRRTGQPIDHAMRGHVRDMVAAGNWFRAAPEPKCVDGRYRAVGMTYLVIADKVRNETWGQDPESLANRALIAEFERRMLGFDAQYSAITRARKGRNPVSLEGAVDQGDGLPTVLLNMDLDDVERPENTRGGR